MMILIFRKLCATTLCGLLFACNGEGLNQPMMASSAEETGASFSEPMSGAAIRPALASSPMPESRGMMKVAADSAQRADQKYLAYEHSVELHVAEDEVAAAHSRIVQQCKQDQANACSVLNANVRSGAHAHASIRLRLKKKGISEYVAELQTSGDLIAQSVHVDDLAKPVVDTERRLKMLTEQRDQLSEMRAQVGKDFDALIRITREISNLQNQIERLSGSRAHLMERIDLDILNVQISSQGRRSFWTPVAESLSRFASNLSVGISNVVSTTAFFLPWLVLIVPGLFAARFLLRWLRKEP